MAAAGLSSDAMWATLRVMGCMAAGFLALERSLNAVHPGRKTRPYELGKSKDSTDLSVIVAYNSVAAVHAGYCSVVGCGAWFNGEANWIGGSARHRLYGTSGAFESLATWTMAYEFLNTMFCIVVPQYRTAAFISHHAVTCLLALLSFAPFLHYYGIFFFGVAAVSNVPLSFVDIFTAAGFVGCDKAARSVFALAFLAIRAAYWPVVSFGFWQDSVQALRSEQGVHSTVAVLTYLGANIGLTLLQFLWTTKVVRGVAKALGLLPARPKRP